MENRILVAYTSVHGSTREVAEFVAKTLRGQGLSVDLEPMSNVISLDGYGAVVLGAPLYMFHWTKDMNRFLARHRGSLEKMPAAIFTGGPYGSMDESEWDEVRRQTTQELAKFGWFKPLSVEVIGGRHNPSTLRFPWSLVPALKQMPPKDLRDWDKIRAWAESLLLLVKAAKAEPEVAQ